MGLLDQFFGNFSMLGGNVPSAVGAKPAQGAQAGGQGGTGNPVVDAILKRINGMGQPQQQPQGGANPAVEMIEAYRGDPLGKVARSNARPSGFTPQAEWDSWGPAARKPAPTSDAQNALRFGGGGGSVMGQGFTGPYGSGSVTPPTVVPAGPAAPLGPPASASPVPQNTVPSGRPEGPTQPQMPQGPMDVFNSFLTATPTPQVPGAAWRDEVAQRNGATMGPEGWSIPGPQPALPMDIPTTPNPLDAFLNPTANAQPQTFQDQAAISRGAVRGPDGWQSPGPTTGNPFLDQTAQARGATWDNAAGGWSASGPQVDPRQLLALLSQAFGMPAPRAVQ